MKLDLLPNIQYSRKKIGDFRYYIINGKKYRGVTSYINMILNLDEKFKEWRDNVGELEADRICKEATDFGTNLHKVTEDFVKGKEYEIEDDLLYTLTKRIKHLLRNKVNIIRGIEYVCFSDELRVAGTTDLIAEWGGELAVIDYKTSKYEKPAEWLESYWLQLDLYLKCLKEMYQLPIKKQVIVMAVKQDKKIIILENNI